MIVLPVFRVLVADPAWQFDDDLPPVERVDGTFSEGRGATNNYATESLDDLLMAALPCMMHRDSVLCLWRVSAMVPEAYRVVEAWGFTPKCEIVWCKLTRTGKRWFGMGRTVRNEHEICIIATRGKGAMRPTHGIFKKTTQRSTFEARVPSWINPRTGKLEYKHSAKPRRFYEIVQNLFVGPYFERNARVQRPGWHHESGWEHEFYQPLCED